MINIDKINKMLDGFLKSKNLAKHKDYEVFVNHMMTVIERGRKDSYNSMPIEKYMIDEIGSKNLELAEELSNIVANEFSLPKFSDFEIFLVATHLSLMKRSLKWLR